MSTIFDIYWYFTPVFQGAACWGFPLLLQTRTARLVACRYLRRNFLFHVSQSIRLFVLPPKSLREIKKKKMTRHIVSSLWLSLLYRGNLIGRRPFSPSSFFIWCLRWVESICCLIKALQPAGRPQPLAERRAVTDPTSSLQRLLLHKRRCYLFLTGRFKKIKDAHPFAAKKHAWSYFMARK